MSKIRIRATALVSSLVLSLAMAGCTDAGADSGAGSSFDGDPSRAAAAPGGGGGRGTVEAGDLLRLKMVEIMDEQGWGAPVVAYRFLAPVDWVVEGGIQWNASTQCSTDMVTAQFRARSPDGAYHFEAFPIFFSQWVEDAQLRSFQEMDAQQGKCRVGPPFEARQFLAEILTPAFRPGAQVSSTAPAPDVVRAVEQNYRELAAAMPNLSVSIDAATAVISYSESGSTFEEKLMASTAVTSDQIMSFQAMSGGPMTTTTQYYSFAENVFGFKAPQGQLAESEALFGAMLRSLQPNPAWQRALSQFRQNINNIAIQGMRDRAEIWRRASQEAADIRNRSWLETQESNDRVAESFGRYIRDVDAYVDSSTGSTIELAAGYENAWSNGGNEFLLSTQPGFDPNVAQIEGSWTQLNRGR